MCEVMGAVMQNGMALQFAPAFFATDPEIALAAVKQNGLALELLGAEQQADPGLALAAVVATPKALSLLSETFTLDREFVRSAELGR